MPNNKNHASRIEILNALFRTRAYTLEELVRRVSNQIGPISARSIQYDINFMRKQGAPIKCENSRYIYDPLHYHIHQVSPPSQALEKLRETITLLQGLPGLGIVEELENLYQEISMRAHEDEANLVPVVHFDFKPGYVGHEYLPDLYDSIRHQTPIRFKYRPFTAEEDLEVQLFPYCLKAYNGRWFLIGQQISTSQLRNYGLERIESPVRPLKNIEWRPMPGFDPAIYFSSIVGVTLPEDGKVEKVVLRVKKPRAYYLLTNPWHHTLDLIKENKKWADIGLEVMVNKELESLILSLGKDVEVISPPFLRSRIAELLSEAMSAYAKSR
jgi:predicted DNA-binding transcriptional regulator YafY